MSKRSRRRGRHEIHVRPWSDPSSEVKPGPNAGKPAPGASRNPVRQIVFSLDARGAGNVLRRILPWLVGTIPVLQGAGFLTHGWMVAAVVVFLVAFGLQIALEYFKESSALSLLTARFAEINSAFGGSIASLARDLGQSCEQLDDGECRYLCAGLLHRIRDYAAATLGSGPRLRATLAVPILEAKSPDATALRVWCYDATHGDRHWTRLEMNWPGAPSAYKKREVQIITDVNALRGLTRLPERQFKSVICIPVVSTDDHRFPLGVVNIDADVANYFDLKSFLTTVNPLIAPAVQLIGMVLQSRKEGVAYEFGK